MEFIKRFLPVIKKFIIWETPKQILMLFLFCLMSLISITLFEQRTNIFNATTNNLSLPPMSVKKIVVPNDIDIKIQNLLNQQSNIAFISLVSADLRVNQREMVYFYSNNSLVNLIHDEALKLRGKTHVIFGADEKENEQMVAMINGEFACYKYDETSNMRLAPRGNVIIPYLCRISLPPYYGEFSGYLTFGLKSEPDQAQKDRLKLEGTRLSTEIYFRGKRL